MFSFLDLLEDSTIWVIVAFAIFGIVLVLLSLRNGGLSFQVNCCEKNLTILDNEGTKMMTGSEKNNTIPEVIVTKNETTDEATDEATEEEKVGEDIPLTFFVGSNPSFMSASSFSVAQSKTEEAREQTTENDEVDKTNEN